VEWTPGIHPGARGNFIEKIFTPPPKNGKAALFVE
jgi:hypothetical protein